MIPALLNGLRVRPTRGEVHYVDCVDSQGVPEKGIEDVDTRRALATDCRDQFSADVRSALVDYLKTLPRRKDASGHTDDPLTGMGEVAKVVEGLVRDFSAPIGRRLDQRAERKAAEQAARDARHDEATRISQEQVAAATNRRRFAMLNFLVAWRTPEDQLPPHIQRAITERRGRIQDKNARVRNRGFFARMAAALGIGGEEI